MEKPREDRNLFAESAKALAEHYANLGDIRSDFRNASLNHLLVKEVKAGKGSRVLDVGCGSGFLLGLLREEGESVVGIEPNDVEMALGVKYNPGIRILKGFAEDIDSLLAVRVDSIVMADVLEHIEDDRGQLQKFYEHLEEGGRLILVVPAYRFLYGKRDRQALSKVFEDAGRRGGDGRWLSCYFGALLEYAWIPAVSLLREGPKKRAQDRSQERAACQAAEADRAEASTSLVSGC